MIMAILAQGQRHGYALQRELEERIVFLDGTPDLSGIYRALKEMEARGFVESTWETGESGPAKRCYGLTASGRDCLAKWRQTLSIYREQLDAVLSLMNESKPEV
jgi:Predicted transcriptional regulators